MHVPRQVLFEYSLAVADSVQTELNGGVNRLLVDETDDVTQWVGFGRLEFRNTVTQIAMRRRAAGVVCTGFVKVLVFFLDVKVGNVEFETEPQVLSLLFLNLVSL